MLCPFGYKNGLNMTLLWTVARRFKPSGAGPCEPDMSQLCRKIQSDLRSLADFSTQVPARLPRVAKRGVGDLNLAGWGPRMVWRRRVVVLRAAVRRAPAPTAGG